MKTVRCGTRDLVPCQGSSPSPLPWERGVLATGPPGQAHSVESCPQATGEKSCTSATEVESRTKDISEVNWAPPEYQRPIFQYFLISTHSHKSWFRSYKLCWVAYIQFSYWSVSFPVNVTCYPLSQLGTDLSKAAMRGGMKQDLNSLPRNWTWTKISSLIFS